MKRCLRDSYPRKVANLFGVRVRPEARAQQRIEMWSDGGEEPALFGEHEQAQHAGHS
jgi:hypothetical protein